MPSIKSIASKVKNASQGLESGLKKLVIKAYNDAACSKAKSGDEFVFKVQFNPTTIDESVSVEYTESNASGTSDGVKKFKHINSSDLTITLTLDGTGVTEAGKIGPGGLSDLSEKDTFVSKSIESFKKVTCAYDGDTHEVPYVNVLWGKLDFKGRLKELKISHVMFNSQGKPLRSVLTATFSSAKDLKTQVKEQGNNSPDLTHTRTVQTGDTLPLMCQRIYNDSSYYLKVAKFNNLIDFRNIEPGTEIIFPPVL